MKKIISLVVAMTFLSSIACADCTFSSLTHNADGSVTYSKADHVCVGQLVQDNATKTQQITDYKQAIDLKDLAITKADQRIQLWIDTSLKLEANVQQMDNLKNTNQWLYFGLGVLTTFAAGYSAAKIIGH